MRISSPAFRNNEKMPSRYTCDGTNVSPPLAIEEVPAGAKSIAFVVYDPDAPNGMFVHWLAYNIIPTGSTLKIGERAAPGTQGMNSNKRRAYIGPCPASGTHRYFFKAYALNDKLQQDSGMDKTNLERAIYGHVIAEAEFVAMYEKNK